MYDGVNPYTAPGLPRPIADNDPSGTITVIDGSGDMGDSGDLPDEPDGDGPSFQIEIAHSYVGDLAIRAGSADAGEGTVTCSVDALSPDPSNQGDGGLAGTIDLSECADQYPPTEQTRWFVEVVDTAGLDEGSVESLTLTGPDGDTIDFDDLPVAIPDDDPQGVVLLTDGERAQPTSSGASRAPQLTVDIEHPYRGDLSVEVGAVDRSDRVLCQVRLSSPDPADNEADLVIDEALDECARQFPPSAERRWYLEIVDTLAQDTGRFLGATLTGPDGDRYGIEGPVAIPDADPEGLVFLFAAG